MLPKSIVKGNSEEINSLLIIGPTKIGKTSLMSALPKNIILGFEKGAEKYDNFRVMINSLKDLSTVIKELKEDTSFEYITLDTITSMEHFIYDLAELKFSETLQGKNWFSELKDKYKRIDALPQGSGYRYIDQAIESIMDSLDKTGKKIIYLGHLKFTTMEKENVEITVKDVDVMSRFRKALITRCEGICFLERRGENQNYLSFKNNGLIGSSWIEKLANKDIAISEKKDSVLVTHWDLIFQNIINKTNNKQTNQ